MPSESDSEGENDSADLGTDTDECICILGCMVHNELQMFCTGELSRMGMEARDRGMDDWEMEDWGMEDRADERDNMGDVLGAGGSSDVEDISDVDDILGTDDERMEFDGLNDLDEHISLEEILAQLEEELGPQDKLELYNIRMYFFSFIS
jgi:hypothetical protein